MAGANYNLVLWAFYAPAARPQRKSRKPKDKLVKAIQAANSRSAGVQDGPNPAHLAVIRGRLDAEQERLAETRKAGKTNGGEKEEEKPL